jgi:hypothetical protein
MPKFNTGDRVRLTDEDTVRVLGEHGLKLNMVGTVVGYNLHNPMVVFDDCSSRKCYFGRERTDGHWRLGERALELVSAAPAFQLNERVRYTGPLSSLVGKEGHLLRLRDGQRADIRFDHDGLRERVVELSNLTRVENTMKNFKTMVTEAVTKLLAVLSTDSAKEQAVRKLGVAQELCRVGDNAKKAAKTQLTQLGIITGGVQNGVVFDSPNYVMTAKTNAASTRFDQAAVETAMIAAGVSAAKRRDIIAAGTVENKAATSFTVEVK